MIFVDTNVFYNVLFDTKFTPAATKFIEQQQELATSFAVVNELVFVSVRNLCEERYGTRNYASFRKFISQRGYGPFKKDLDTIFRFIDDVEVCLVPTNDDTNCWRKIMHRYKLLPYDALIVSACISNGINKIATFDKDFRRVDLLELVELKE